MDGFNVVPIDSEVKKDNNTSFESGIEIIDQEKELEKQKAAENSGGWLLFFAIMSFVGVLCYLGYLVINRTLMMQQVVAYGEQMRSIGKDIDVKEIQEFQAMDVTLNAIKGRLEKHVLNSKLLSLVNSNLRNSILITEYRLDVKDKEVEVNLNAVAPSFKELAEQTEKMYSLKDSKQIRSFNVTNLSLEQETKRIKFSLKIIFDKKNITAGSTSSLFQQPENI